MLRFLTAGESHGQALVAIVEGMPAGVPIDVDAITRDLRRRQGGYGRGRRMAIESDRAEILSGVRRGHTTGGPIALLIPNKDWQNWQRTMSIAPEAPADATGANRAPVTRPRPGHADLAGTLKYELDDIRDVLERASARETAARVATAGLTRQLLAAFDIQVLSHVVRIGDVAIPEALAVPVSRIRAIPDDSPLHCADPSVEQRMIAGNRRGARGGRHARRRLRGRGHRLACRSRQLRAMGPQARWQARAGDDVDSGDQGRGHRKGAGGR